MDRVLKLLIIVYTIYNILRTKRYKSNNYKMLKNYTNCNFTVRLPDHDFLKDIKKIKGKKYEEMISSNMDSLHILLFNINRLNVVTFKNLK